MLQSQADAVQTVQHAVAAESVNFKAVRFIACFNHFGFQIDFKLNARLGVDQLKQLIDLRFAQGDRQQLIVKAVAVEDIGEVSLFQATDIGEMTGHGRRGCHGRADQVSTPAAALTAFKVTVAGGGAALARVQAVVVHRQAHGAAG